MYTLLASSGMLAALLCSGLGCSASFNSTGGKDGGDLAKDASASADSDGDGITDAAEGRNASGGAVDTDGDGTPDYLDPDSDDDGIPDAVESDSDYDRDGTPNYRDEDSDGDGILDSVEGGALAPDTDSDGSPDYLDLDSDGDGIADFNEGSDTGGGPLPPDTDGDGTADFRDLDSDADSLLDIDEGTGDWDGDGIANYRDPKNDGAPLPITLKAISTTFNKPIGIDYYEPTKSVVITVNYPNGQPLNFERIEVNGDHQAFSDMSGMTDEIKIATARAGNPAGFPSGDLFVGNGSDGQIVRITDQGSTVINPWVDLPGTSNGLIRGSLYVDRTGEFGGDLIIVTTLGQVWRIDLSGTPTKLADLGVHLEGMITVPNSPTRYGPLAGKIIAGAEQQGLLWAIGSDGSTTSYNVGVDIEDIDIISPKENFFGVNYGTNLLLGAAADQFESLIGDVLLTQEGVNGTTGLFRLQWTGSDLSAEPIPISAASAVPAQWEHVTFAPAGIVEVPPIQ